MAADDIKKHQFTSENQPKKRRSRKGIPNRATVYRNLLDLLVSAPDPQGRGYIKLTLYEAMALGQIRAAMRGNTRAWIEIQDSLFGKQASEVGLTLSRREMKMFLDKLSDKELDQLVKDNLAQRGYNKLTIPMISHIQAVNPTLPTIEELKEQWERERIEFEQKKQERLRQVEELEDDGP
jgi:hypothetical protein